VRFATPRSPGEFLDAVAGAAAHLLRPGERPAAIGIGVPGPLDAARGLVISSPNIGWRELPIADLVSARFDGLPVAIDDDANSGALGEAVAGAGRGFDPYAYLPLGTGLGCGVVVGGSVLHGAHGAAGEIGHLAVGDRVGPRCACGRRNCVEDACAGGGLARSARRTWPAARLADGSPAPRDAAAVLALAGTGDPDARVLVARARHALAVAIAAILAAVDPAALTVGGTIGAAQPALVRAAFREATGLVHRDVAGGGVAGAGVRLRRPRLGEASVLGGAAVLAVRAAQAAQG
jgi:glucokinase